MKDFEPTKEEMKIIYDVIRKRFSYLNMSYYFDDLESLGLFATWKARNTYDETKGVKYTTYQWRTVFNELYIFKKSEMDRKKDIPKEKMLSKDYEGKHNIEEDKTSLLHELSYSFEENVDFEMDFKLFHKTLKPVDQCILTELQNGSTLTEIANVVGVSFQRIGQRRKQIENDYRVFKRKGVC